MENETYKVRTFLESIVQCGAAQAFAMLEPASDLLSQRKAYAFLKAYDTRFGGQWEHGEAWLAQQVAEGAVKPVRKGHHKNSPMCYSKAQLLKALLTEDAVRNDIFKGTNI
ncbi:MAG: hypothetical protein NC403_09415 [Muribaculaceae bacterium]|nr:hypothetical protein [Muribaculaceae bacterium]MCM1220966.1 hypothetical protein [Lachnospiraceae bacterium]MCM1532768.1 hypothetical protein [Ruminococcus flavefaciens]